MTRYEEILAAIEAYRREFADYREACGDFAADLVRHFGDYLGCPAGALRVVPAEDNPDSPTPELRDHPLPDAMHLGDDGWWHFNVVVTLATGAGEVMTFAGLLTLKMRIKRLDGFLVTAEQLDETFRVAEGGGAAGLLPFFDHICERVIQDFREYLRNQIRGAESHFGFRFVR